MKLPAYAKLNWDLHILGRRPDGFHELDSVFVTIDLKDELTFRPSTQLRLTCSDASLSCGEDNLIARAARTLAHAAEFPAQAEIHLEKKIPMGGGLGGGSSDAATTLLGLNRLWRLNWPVERLAQLGAKLGSDVSYFLTGGWCRCRGRGEIVEILPECDSWPSLRLLLIVPPTHVPTPAVYKNLNAPMLTHAKKSTRTLTSIAQELSLASNCLKKGVDGSYRFVNDLLIPAQAVEPKLITTGNILHRFFPNRWQMSGSGAVHFVVPDPELEAETVKERLNAALPFEVNVVEVHTTNRHLAG